MAEVSDRENRDFCFLMRRFGHTYNNKKRTVLTCLILFCLLNTAIYRHRFSSSQEPKADAAVWHSYEEPENYIYYHDFMASRDGQGYHWWIYCELAYILCDYSEKTGYDFTADTWIAERIFPVCDGYYNAVISQDTQNTCIALLFRPDEKKYVILYAQYEDGDRTAGVSQIPFSSQLSWKSFDFHEHYDAPSVRNPYADICETSVSTALYIPLSHYEQKYGVTEEWNIRELFGRSPFFDYLVESEQLTVWFCVDIGQHFYTCVTLSE